MARKISKKKSAELKSQSMNQKKFVDPGTAAVLGAIGWFSFKAIAQAIIGWLGLTTFIRWQNKWKNRGKSGDRETTELSTEESAAAS